MRQKNDNDADHNKSAQESPTNASQLTKKEMKAQAESEQKELNLSGINGTSRTLVWYDANYIGVVPFFIIFIIFLWLSIKNIVVRILSH